MGKRCRLFYLSRSPSIRFTDTRVDTPFSCIVIPYRISAASIVPFLWDMTMNCVSLVSLFRYFANLLTFESSRAASISSRRQNGDGFRLEKIFSIDKFQSATASTEKLFEHFVEHDLYLFEFLCKLFLHGFLQL